MFERYSEKGRRVIFFAQYEATQFNSPAVTGEHLLLALLRENKRFLDRFDLSESSIRKHIESHQPAVTIKLDGERPLSHEAKRILAYAAEEAERRNDKYVGTNHLFAALFQEENGNAAQLLRELGLKLHEVREQLFCAETLAPGEMIHEEKVWSTDEIKKLWPAAKEKIRQFQQLLKKDHDVELAPALSMAMQLAGTTFEILYENHLAAIRLDELTKDVPDGKWVAFSSDEKRLLSIKDEMDDVITEASESGEQDPIVFRINRRAFL